MGNQLTSNAEALRLFFTEDVYLVKSESNAVLAAPVAENPIQAVESIPSITTEKIVVENLPISVPSIVETKPLQKKWDFEHLGKNQKGILILVNDNVNKVSSPEGTELLRKLVKAIALTNNDFALVNFANYQDAKFEDLSTFFNCQLVLSFGVDAQQLGLTAQPLHQLNELGEIKLIFTSNLHDLDSDTTSKKILWATLQRLK